MHGCSGTIKGNNFLESICTFSMFFVATVPLRGHYLIRVCNLSVQVLEKALEVWDLQIIPLDSPVAEPAKIDPELENAFICHLHDHWFCIRKVNGEWYNFDSLYPAPEHLSKFYLSAYLSSLKELGWSIFLVRGNFPKESLIASSEESSNGYGQWLSPEDAVRITKSCNNAQGRAAGTSQTEGFLELPYDAGDLSVDEDDADLRAAIAASLMDSASTTVNTGAADTSNDDKKNTGKENL